MLAGRRALSVAWRRHCLGPVQVTLQGGNPLPPLVLLRGSGIPGSLQQQKSFATPAKPPEERPRLVILGTGWAATELLCHLDARSLKQYQITVCSPTNHFVNTPLLPSVTVGTMDPRSIVHPTRQILAKHRHRCPEASIKFNEVMVEKVDPEKKQILCKSRSISETLKDSGEIWVDYDVLVMATGATTNTFGTPGALENCNFLKTVQDAMKIRTSVLDCFEAAVVKARQDGVDDPEVKRLLTFVMVGAGPTGVEIAAELRDFIKEDVKEQYLGLRGAEIKVQIVEMSSKMLGTYAKVIQDYTAEVFKRSDIEMLTEHQVKKVNKTSVEVMDLKTKEMKTLPFGVCVWASGVKPSEVSLDLAKTLHGGGMLQVDPFLRVRGSEGSIFAMGDCAKITRPTLLASVHDLFVSADVNGDGVLSEAEFEAMIMKASKEFPHLMSFLRAASSDAIHKMYEKAAGGKVDGISEDVFAAALAEVDKEMKMLPPTAQVAAQEGSYLAELLNGVPYEKLGHDGGFDREFQYNHQGSLAYVGGENAVFQSDLGVFKGLATYAMWKVVYFYSSVSFRMRLNLVFNWAKTWFLGRDTSRF